MAFSFRNLLKFNIYRTVNLYSTISINLLSSYKFQHTMSGENLKTEGGGQKLSDVVQMLDHFADPKFAEKWDNVGLLIEPFSETQIHKIMLTNDLTEHVLEEGIRKEINLIISYHPPIFVPMKRITKATWKERIVAGCLENRIAVYSPHTSWDAVYGGVTDWLCDAFKKYEKEEEIRIPIIPSETVEEPNTSNNEITRNSKRGMGIIISVQLLSLEECVLLLKFHLGLQKLRISFGKDKTMESFVRKIAIVPGSGGSLLKGVEADLYVTGEMFHHDLLEASHNGVSVILTNHSDSERGFLKNMARTIEKSFMKSVEVIVSERDKDPIRSV